MRGSVGGEGPRSVSIPWASTPRATVSTSWCPDDRIHRPGRAHHPRGVVRLDRPRRAPHRLRRARRHRPRAPDRAARRDAGLARHRTRRGAGGPRRPTAEQAPRACARRRPAAARDRRRSTAIFCTATHPTTPGCGGWSPRRSPAAGSTRSPRGSNTSPTRCWTTLPGGRKPTCSARSPIPFRSP